MKFFIKITVVMIISFIAVSYFYTNQLVDYVLPKIINSQNNTFSIETKKINFKELQANELSYSLNHEDLKMRADIDSLEISYDPFKRALYRVDIKNLEIDIKNYQISTKEGNNKKTLKEIRAPKFESINIENLSIKIDGEVKLTYQGNLNITQLESIIAATLESETEILSVTADDRFNNIKLLLNSKKGLNISKATMTRTVEETVVADIHVNLEEMSQWLDNAPIFNSYKDIIGKKPDELKGVVEVKLIKEDYLDVMLNINNVSIADESLDYQISTDVKSNFKYKNDELLITLNEQSNIRYNSKELTKDNPIEVNLINDSVIRVSDINKNNYLESSLSLGDTSILVDINNQQINVDIRKLELNKDITMDSIFSIQTSDLSSKTIEAFYKAPMAIDLSHVNVLFDIKYINKQFEIRASSIDKLEIQKIKSDQIELLRVSAHYQVDGLIDEKKNFKFNSILDINEEFKIKIADNELLIKNVLMNANVDNKNNNNDALEVTVKMGQIINDRYQLSLNDLLIHSKSTVNLDKIELSYIINELNVALEKQTIPLKVNGKIKRTDEAVDIKGNMQTSKLPLIMWHVFSDDLMKSWNAQLSADMLVKDLYDHVGALLMDKKTKEKINVSQGRVIANAKVINKKSMTSSADIKINDLTLTYNDIKINTMNTSLNVNDLFSPKLSAVTTISNVAITPDFVIDDVILNVDADNHSIRSIDGDLKLLGGNAKIKSKGFDFDALQKKINLDVLNVDLSEIVKLSGRQDLELQGRMSGRLPIQMTKEGPSILNGRLVAIKPGVIRYKSPLGAQSGNIALQALNNLLYSELELDVNFDDTGEYLLATHLLGKNPDLYSGYPVKLNMNISGKLPIEIRKALLGQSVESQVLENVEQ